MMNVRYMLGAKIQDATVDNVYYDRGVSILLEPGESARLQRLPDLQTTAIGAISSTEGARDQKDDTVAALLVVTNTSGDSYSMPLRLGLETGETPEKDAENKPASHRKPREVPAWAPFEGSPEYFAKIPLPSRWRIKDVYIKNVMVGATLRVRALTFVDDVGAVSSPLVLSDRLDRELFFDMKLYSVRDPLPRAFVVHSSVVREDRASLDALQRPVQPLAQLAVLSPSPTARQLFRSAPAPFSPAEAKVIAYRPEEVAIEVDAAQDGYLLLMDVYYPGWIAEVDGVPAPIERANYLFRGVFVDSGKHSVVFRFAPRSFQIGVEITLASLGVISATLFGLAVGRWRHGKRPMV
jgi:hypothetical protein